MNIVHVCRVAPPSAGGMESVLRGMTAVQQQEGHAVRVVTLAPWGGGLDVPVTSLAWRGLPSWPVVLGLRAALEGADFIHAHGLDALTDQVLTCRPRDAVVGVSTHGGYFHTPRARRIKQLWLRSVTRISLRRASAVWFDSRADAEVLSAGLPQGEVVENGVELREMREVRSARSPQPGRWVMLGRIDVHKGLEDALMALAAAQVIGQHARLDIIGACAKPAYYAHLKEMAHNLGLAERVHWHGSLSSKAMRSILTQAELALFPSKHEGFGVALVELMAAGIPVIARAIPPHAERLADQVHGRLVDFADTPAVVRAALAIRDDPAQTAQFVAAAIERAEESSWARRASSWREAYARACGGGR